MKQMAQLEFDSPTLGSLCDPYRRPVSLLQSGILYNPVRLAPWIYHRFRYWLQGYMAELQAKTSIPDFHKKLMAEEVARLYRKISQAQADYRLDEVKDVSTGRCGICLLLDIILVHGTEWIHASHVELSPTHCLPDVVQGCWLYLSFQHVHTMVPCCYKSAMVTNVYSCRLFS